MPSYRVVGSTHELNIFDVVGRDGAKVGFIDHTGLAKSGGSQQTAKIPVLDMGPPLHGQDSSGHIKANVVGSATLTDDEVQKIRTFVDRHANEHLVFLQFDILDVIRAAPQMYCILPHVSRLRENDDRYARERFSCAGFVFEAYKKARINLLDPSTLPMVDIAIIKLGYPNLERLMKMGEFKLEDLGLKGPGPWPVLLCGYLFHALNRNGNAIRNELYIPSVLDRYFN